MRCYGPRVQWDIFWSAVEAVATVIGAAATIAGVIIAVRSLWALKADSTDRSRPVVIAELVIPPLGDHQMNLVISNQGGSAARDLRVTFTPDPLVLADDPRPAQLAIYLVRRYARPIALLGVGAKLSNVYASMEGGAGRISEPLPTTFQVHVEYSDMERRHTYRDTFDLDLDVIATATFSRPGDKDYDKRTAKALEAIARGVGEI